MTAPVSGTAIAQRERQLGRLLSAWISSGLLFLLLPGTFLGVWNLLQISREHSPSGMSPAWLQAHGQAQIFGWVGSFILGIGLHAIPRLRRSRPFPLWLGWTCWGLWCVSVLLHWLAGVASWHWRILLPASAAGEWIAFALFLSAVARHRDAQPSGESLPNWIRAVLTGMAGFALALTLNLGGSIVAARHAPTPAFPHLFDEIMIVVMTWGFLIPTIWGFSARWLPVFLGVNQPRARLFNAALAANSFGVIAIFFNQPRLMAALLFAGGLLAVLALRLAEPALRPAKTTGVHASFPVFVRIAYGWMLISATLGLVAAWSPTLAPGWWGASRHALTVGMIALMILNIGQRVLPAFAGMKLLFSPRLMFAASLLLTLGCTLRVSAEAAAYGGTAHWAWTLLPWSAWTEFLAIGLFAFNLQISLARPRPSNRGIEWDSVPTSRA